MYRKSILLLEYALRHPLFYFSFVPKKVKVKMFSEVDKYMNSMRITAKQEFQACMALKGQPLVKHISISDECLQKSALILKH